MGIAPAGCRATRCERTGACDSSRSARLRQPSSVARLQMGRQHPADGRVVRLHPQRRRRPQRPLQLPRPVCWPVGSARPLESRLQPALVAVASLPPENIENTALGWQRYGTRLRFSVCLGCGTAERACYFVGVQASACLLAENSLLFHRSMSQVGGTHPVGSGRRTEP